MIVSKLGRVNKISRKRGRIDGRGNSTTGNKKLARITGTQNQHARN
jgi:hypothetical protein